MATIGNGVITLADIGKSLDPNGQLAAVIELLNNSHEIIDDMSWMEGNIDTGHRFTQRTSIPTASFRMFNQGVPIVKTTRAQQTETCSILEDWLKADKAEINLGGRGAAFKTSETKGIMEGMTQKLATTTFYGSLAQDPAGLIGLANRYWSVNSANGNQASNVLDSGGTGSTNTSVYFIGWSPETVTGIYPKGSKAGLQVNDMGTQIAYDASGNPYAVEMVQFTWQCGLAVLDWRYVIRICNIDVSLFSGGSAANLYRQMIRAINIIPNLNGKRFAFYGNRAFKTWADIQATEKSTNAFQVITDNQGKMFTGFRGYPVRLCDQILSTESRVV